MRALYIQWRVGVGTNSLILSIAPEGKVLDNLSMCVCQQQTTTTLYSHFHYRVCQTY